MRHRNALRKLGRSTAHRQATLRSLTTSLILHEKIETTLPKAKELKRLGDKLVTLGKRNTLHARRQAMAFLFTINRQANGNAKKLTAVHRLFTDIAPRYGERNGGYTRVVRTRRREGDNTQLALVAFVEEVVQKKPEGQRKRRVIKGLSMSSAQVPTDNQPQPNEADQ